MVAAGCIPDTQPLLDGGLPSSSCWSVACLGWQPSLSRNGPWLTEQTCLQLLPSSRDNPHVMTGLMRRYEAWPLASVGGISEGSPQLQSSLGNPLHPCHSSAAVSLLPFTSLQLLLSPDYPPVGLCPLT